jgi:hypothetical protein
MSETWRVVPSSPRHVVSNTGRVAVLKTKRILSQLYDSSGYRIVSIWGQGGRFRVHNLVAEAFLGKKPFGAQVNHKDGNKSNNTPENLEYISQKENLRHAFRTGLMKNTGRKKKET